MSVLSTLTDLIVSNFVSYLITEGILSFKEKRIVREIEKRVTEFNSKFDDTEVDSIFFIDYLERIDVKRTIIERVFETYKTSKKDYGLLSKELAENAINYVNSKKDEINYPHVKKTNDFEKYFEELFIILINYRESLLSLKDKIIVSMIGETIISENEGLIRHFEKRHELEIEKHIYSIEDIDANLRRETISPQIGLDFFTIDDEEFKSEFHKRIDMDKIFIVGRCKEETIYCILNEIQKLNLSRKVLLVRNINSWEEIENQKIKGAILLPWFDSENIVAIDGNTNVFVYAEDDPVPPKDCLKLRKRTKRTIVNCLEVAGLDYRQAYNLVEDTHGLFALLKSAIFKGAIYRKPNWAENRSKALLAALLCGKWTECEGDKLVLEELAGMSYDNIMSELTQYMTSESPFIIEKKAYVGSVFQLAGVDLAWKNLVDSITPKLWGDFVELLYEVLIESEPIFEYPFEKHFAASLIAKKPDWSPSLKHGMLRSLILKVYYGKDYSCQYQVNNVVKKILETITTVQRWGYISQYFVDLCEAAPDIVLKRLEDELVNPTGLKELFESKNGDYLTSRNYYTNILWAVEQLLLQKEYVVRAIKWLWQVDDLNIKYNITNSPKSILERVYCSWFNITVLAVEEKIQLAEWAIANYENAWDLVCSELPSGSRTIFSNINQPRYRDVDEVEVLYVSDVNKTHLGYIKACMSKMDASPDRWKKIIKTLNSFSEELLENILKRFLDEIVLMSDEEKVIVKDVLRYEIYRHRYYRDSNWAMDENRIEKLENVMNQIKTTDRVYDYLYLFGPKYNYPLVQPIPYEKDSEIRSGFEDNDLLREAEVEKGIDEFVINGLSIERLLVLSSDINDTTIGTSLAKYYKSREFDESILEMMLNLNVKDQIVIDYVCHFVVQNDSILKSAIDLVKKAENRENLLISLLAIEMISAEKLPLIEYENEEIKKRFWEGTGRFNIRENRDSYLWAISECEKYGDLNAFLELLFNAMSFFSPDDVYVTFVIIGQIRVGVPFNTMTEYYLKELLKLVHKNFMSDAEKCVRIACVEGLFMNVLDWNHMKCTQMLMKETPLLYAQLISYIFKNEDGEKSVKSTISTIMDESLFRLYQKAHFCPAEKVGKVDYNDLLSWINEFRELLNFQKQSHLFSSSVGRLFAHSPVGDDNFMPSEAVREIIEEVYDESLKNAYVIAETNKRGTFSPNAGKTELEMSRRYKDNADNIRLRYPKTASIYDLLSDSYKVDSLRERKNAEDDW